MPQDKVLFSYSIVKGLRQAYNRVNISDKTLPGRHMRKIFRIIPQNGVIYGKRPHKTPYRDVIRKLSV